MRLLTVLGMSLLLLSACILPSSGERDEVSELGSAASELLDTGFAFEGTWEDSNFGPDGGTLNWDGAIAVTQVKGRYTPMIDATGGSEVRISGKDLFVGSTQEGWLTSKAPPGESWLELMPLAGAPVLRLQHLADGGYERVDAEVPDREGAVCERYQAVDVEPTLSPATGSRELLYDPTVLIPVTSFTACTAEGELRLLTYPPSDPSGALTFEFQSLKSPVAVVPPSENVTEVETPGEGGVQEEGALDIVTEGQDR